jgi:hypothetical protein
MIDTELYPKKHRKAIVKTGKIEQFQWIITTSGFFPLAYVGIPPELRHGLTQTDFEWISNVYINFEADVGDGHPTFPDFSRELYWIGWDYGHSGDYNNDCPFHSANEPVSHAWTITEIEADIQNVINQIQIMVVNYSI